MKKTVTPNMEIMKVILDEELKSTIDFIDDAKAEDVYSRLFNLMAFQLSHEMLTSDMYMKDEVAGIIAAHPNVLTHILTEIDNDDDYELTPQDTCRIIDKVLKKLKNNEIA